MKAITDTFVRTAPLSFEIAQRKEVGDGQKAYRLSKQREKINSGDHKVLSLVLMSSKTVEKVP